MQPRATYSFPRLNIRSGPEHGSRSWSENSSFMIRPSSSYGGGRRDGLDEEPFGGIGSTRVSDYEPTARQRPLQDDRTTACLLIRLGKPAPRWLYAASSLYFLLYEGSGTNATGRQGRPAIANRPRTRFIRITTQVRKRKNIGTVRQVTGMPRRWRMRCGFRGESEVLAALERT